MASGSVSKPFVGAQVFSIDSNSDFATIENALQLQETACVYISPSVANPIFSITGNGHTFGVCCKLSSGVLDFLVNNGATKIYHFRATISESTPSFSNLKVATMT